MLKHGILGLLNYHDMTGYEIKEVFDNSLNFFWTAQTSQIYRELQGLREKGMVTITVIEQEGKPDKKVCSITEKGRKELMTWLSQGGLTVESRSPLLMKVFFLGERSPQENIGCFRKFRTSCEEFLKSLESVEETIDLFENVIQNREKSAYWQMTLDLGRKNMRMYIEWADECIARMEEMI